uniref:putative nuclease HARBI1 n=1 Tax=Pristiophorus japonicus TaxID=55135 RepID=UPI00398F40CE
MLLEELCVKRLRFSKEAIGRLCDMLKDDLQTCSKSRIALSVSMEVTMALDFFASGSFQSGTGDISDMSQCAARSCINQVSEFIDFDLSTWQQKETALAGFPKVIGTVDGTHVALKALIEAPARYINRKWYHSLNVMIVCDAQLRILSVNADHSNLYDALNELPAGSAWILNDKGYPLKPWLMTPYRRTNNEAQERCNQALVGTRQVVERTIGLLKSCFWCLDRSGGTLQYSPVKVSRTVVAYCALYNFALQEGLTVNPADQLPAEMEETEDPNVPLVRRDRVEPTGAKSRAAREQRVANTFRGDDAVASIPPPRLPQQGTEKNTRNLK